MSHYLYDIKLVATLRVFADTKDEAKAKLEAMLEGATVNAGANEAGDPVIFEINIEGEPTLVEIDGEPA